MNVRRPILISAALILAGLAVLHFLLFDWISLQKSLIAEGYPDLSLIGMGRFASLLLCTFGLLVIFASAGPFSMRLGEETGDRMIHRTGWLVNLLSLGFLALLLLMPRLFNALSHEDSYVEWASFIFLAASSVIFMISAWKCRTCRIGTWPVHTLICLAFAGVFFVIAMEEVSWFQRQIGFETPAAFGGNVQEEFNLHNFFTVGFEMLYYFGTFFFFIVLPFLRLVFSDWVERIDVLKIFVPPPEVAVPAAMCCGYNYEMWNILFVQFSFLGALVVLLHFGIISQSLRDRLLLWGTAIILGASQWIFLISKESYERIWEVTEYKELFITIGFLVYSLYILHKLSDRENSAGIIQSDNSSRI